SRCVLLIAIEGDEHGRIVVQAVPPSVFERRLPELLEAFGPGQSPGASCRDLRLSDAEAASMLRSVVDGRIDRPGLMVALSSAHLSNELERAFRCAPGERDALDLDESVSAALQNGILLRS